MVEDNSKLLLLMNIRIFKTNNVLIIYKSLLLRRDIMCTPVSS